ncbi:hypothetical protein E2562_028868 [Oryza meyeriana var. granulata]|uniref:DUF4283 domain-containing protein n=1 Tax=Oryza meyeriana var. granulata TaxID=110450 RepID=A0A6G1FD93_9ORYZ|nr:hypothetical protein E2562_028868 [Oryza meyeriana var. granulata]
MDDRHDGRDERPRRWISRRRPGDGAGNDVRPPRLAASGGGVNARSVQVEVGRPVSVVGAPMSKPKRVIERTANIARMQDVLRRALNVLVVGNNQPVSEEEVITEVARGFDVDPSGLELYRVGQGGFQLVLQDEVAAERVFNEGRPLLADSFRLFFRRWSRYTASSGAASLHLVDVDIRGVPPHAWDIATAQHLLDDACWIRDVHPGTANRRDCFRLSAWCADPGLVPPALDLLIVEPPVDVDEVPPVKRALSYPVEIKVNQSLQPSMGEDSPSPPPAGEDQDRRKRRRRRRRGPSSRDEAGGGAPRLPVDARLGPAPGGHVAYERRSGEASQAFPLDPSAESQVGTLHGPVREALVSVPHTASTPAASFPAKVRSVVAPESSSLVPAGPLLVAKLGVSINGPVDSVPVEEPILNALLGRVLEAASLPSFPVEEPKLDVLLGHKLAPDAEPELDALLDQGLVAAKGSLDGPSSAADQLRRHAMPHFAGGRAASQQTVSETAESAEVFLAPANLPNLQVEQPEPSLIGGGAVLPQDAKELVAEEAPSAASQQKQSAGQAEPLFNS